MTPADPAVFRIDREPLQAAVVGTGLVLWAIVSGQYVHALQFMRGISTQALPGITARFYNSGNSAVTAVGHTGS